MSDAAVSLGRAIMAARSARGVKRSELADLAGVSYPYLAEIEKGAKGGSTRVIERIAAALGMSHSELLASAEAIREGALPPSPQRYMQYMEIAGTRARAHAHREIASMRPVAALRTDLRDPEPLDEFDEEALVRRVAERVRAEIDALLDAELGPAIAAEMQRQREAYRQPR